MNPQPPTPGQPDRPRAVLVQMDTVTPEPIDWLWPGFLARGKLHVIDGDPGLGKSTVTLDWAARVSTGKPWPDGQPGPEPTNVVLLSSEEGIADTIRRRLDAAGADAARVTVIPAITTGTDPVTGEDTERLPALPDDIDLIRDALHEVEAALLVVDPLMAYLASSVNSYRDQDVRRALTPLMRAAEQAGTAVVLVRHLNKGDSDKAVYRGGGSIGIIGAARLGYTVARHPDDPQNASRAVIAGTKANIAKMPPSLAYQLISDDVHECARIDWEGPVDYTASDLLRAAAAPSTENDTSTRWLTDYLASVGGEAAAADVHAAAGDAGIPTRTLQRARVRAGVIAAREGFPSRTMWRLSSLATPGPASDATASIPRATGATGATGATAQAGHPAEIGPCARCQRPTRRYGARAQTTLCQHCRTEQGGAA
ncbi:MAG: AAA family ATPase [Pseudonocardiaceae bacterium]|nr:AAA family ATPase [Pseudonocardiaceae bacterium]